MDGVSIVGMVGTDCTVDSLELALDAVSRLSSTFRANWDVEVSNVGRLGVGVRSSSVRSSSTLSLSSLLDDELAMLRAPKKLPLEVDAAALELEQPIAH